MSTERTVSICLYSDFVSFLRDELTRLGYVGVEHLNDRDLLRTYFDVRKRVVTPKRRSVHKATSFSCPNQYLQAVSDIERLIEIGEDINPHLSRNLKCLRYNDAMLNDWGIHHLHLGEEIEDDGFIVRTGALLYCRFEENDSYFINVLPHGNWNTQKLVTIMHENWPSMLRRYRLHGILGAPISDTEIAELRRKNSNYCLEMADGTVYAPPGGGTVGDGTNVQSVMTASRICDLLRWEQELIVENIDEISDRALEEGVLLPYHAKFELTLQDSYFCAVERSSMVAIRLKEFSRYALGENRISLLANTTRTNDHTSH